MQATIISDTSCFILLSKIGELHLLEELFGEVFTTQIVADEFGSYLPSWVKIQNPEEKSSQLILEATLDQGEASAIALALEMENCLLIIDEFKGRKLARHLGLTITGTLGILVHAKQKGYLPKLKPLLDKVKQTDFRLSERLLQETLKAVGEDDTYRE